LLEKTNFKKVSFMFVRGDFGCSISRIVSGIVVGEFESDMHDIAAWARVDLGKRRVVMPVSQPHRNLELHRHGLVITGETTHHNWKLSTTRILASGLDMRRLEQFSPSSRTDVR
jgi:hypothetical protein